MANITNNSNNPDLLYLKSREDLLQYEDARMNALLQAVADFYSTRNDQSIWGNFLRALAIEFAKYDYNYSYDIVNKDPSFLTPPDIRRRWAAPLYVSGAWPSPQQYDLQYKQMLVALIKAYKMGTTVAAIEGVIFAYTGIRIKVVEFYKLIGDGVYDQSDRNSIGVSVQVGNSGSNPLTTVTSLLQLQGIIQSLYNAIALAKPAHVGLEFTTIFNEGESLDCLLSPSELTQAQFVQMPQTSLPYYTLNGYVQVSPALFWKLSTAFVLGNTLRDSNGNFQLLTSLGASPNTSGPGPFAPIWNTLSNGTTTDGDLTWKNVSPAVVSTSVTADVVTVNLSITAALSVGTVVKLINLSTSTFLNNVPLTVLDVTGTSFTASFTHADYSTVTETTGTATFPLPSSITAIQWNLLNTTWKALYQQAYLLTNCQSSGITDTLRIFVQQSEAPPYGPMLIQAPVLNPANPKTTIAAYGKRLCQTLTPAQWLSLPLIYANIQNGMSDGINATYSFVPTTQFLHEGEILTITGFGNAALNVTAQIKDVVNLAGIINATSVEADQVTVYAPNSFVAQMLVTFSGLSSATYLNGESLVIQSASSTNFVVQFTHADYAKIVDTGNAEVSTFQIPCTTVVAQEVPSPISQAGLVTPTLQSAYYLVNGQYVLGQIPINNYLTLASAANAIAGNTTYTGIITGGASNALVGQTFTVSGFSNSSNNGIFIVVSSTATSLTLNNGAGVAEVNSTAQARGAGVGESWNPLANVFQGQIIVDSNGNTQLALNAGVTAAASPAIWNSAKNGFTNDGSVVWRNVGKDAFSAPKTWVGVLNMNYEFDQDSTTSECTLGFSGEIGNWDPLHQYGLVAPRLSSVWEISGQPQDQNFIFGLY